LAANCKLSQTKCRPTSRRCRTTAHAWPFLRKMSPRCKHVAFVSRGEVQLRLTLERANMENKDLNTHNKRLATQNEGLVVANQRLQRELAESKEQNEVYQAIVERLQTLNQELTQRLGKSAAADKKRLSSSRLAGHWPSSKQPVPNRRARKKGQI